MGQLFATTTSPALTIWNSNSGNLLNLQTGSTQATNIFTVDHNGQTTIGTSTPAGLSTLTVAATTTTSIPLSLKGVSGQAANLFQALYSDNTSALTLTNTGFFGIGTSSPAFTLSVQGNALLGSTTVQGLTATGTIAVQGSGTSTFANGLTTGGMLSTNGLTVQGGSILSSGLLTVTNTGTSTFSGGISTAGLLSSNGFTITTGNLNIPSGIFSVGGTGSSTITNGLTTGGLSSSNGLTITGGSFLSSVPFTNTSSATSTFSGFLTVSGTNSTSTFSGGLTAATLNVTSSSASSTFSNGIRLTNGCFQDTTGTCAINPWTAGSGNISYSGGNVGVGTSTPAQLLSVQGNGYFSGTSFFGGAITGTSTAAFGTTTVTNLISTNTSTSTFAGGLTVGTSQLVVQGATGNVGIGRVSPANKLEIDASGSKGIQFYTSDNGYNDRAGIIYGAADTGSYGSSRITIQSVLAGNILDDTLNIKNGNVGIGTTGPNGRLSLGQNLATDDLIVYDDASAGNRYGLGMGAGTLQIYSASGATKVQIGDRSGTAGAFNPYVTVTQGSVGIGAASPTRALLDMRDSSSRPLLSIDRADGGTQVQFYVGGSAAGNISGSAGPTTNYNTTSDRRIKENIAPTTLGLSTLMQIPVDDFDFISDPNKTRQQGFIAQDVYKIYPQVVTTNGDNGVTLLSASSTPWTIDYGRFTPLLAKSIQDVANAYTLNNLGNGATSTITSWYQGTTSPAITVDTSGNVGIGTTTPNHTLTVAGDVAAIAFVNTSTRAAKTDISYDTASSSEERLNQLVDLKVATYRYTIEDQHDPLRLGFIAEDAQTIAPEILSPDGKGVDIYKLATFTLSGVQALAAKVDVQNTRLTSLVNGIKALNTKLDGAISGGTISLSSGEPTNAWSVDQQSGKVNVNFFGDINMQGNDILDVGKIAGMFGKWKIDEDGTLTAVKVITNEVLTESLSVKSSFELGSMEKPAGMTIYDRTTGEPYCVGIDIGEWFRQKGKCNSTTPSSQPLNSGIGYSTSPETAVATTSPTSSETASTPLPVETLSSSAASTTATTTAP